MDKILDILNNKKKSIMSVKDYIGLCFLMAVNLFIGITSLSDFLKERRFKDFIISVLNIMSFFAVLFSKIFGFI